VSRGLRERFRVNSIGKRQQQWLDEFTAFRPPGCLAWSREKFPNQSLNYGVISNRWRFSSVDGGQPCQIRPSDQQVGDTRPVTGHGFRVKFHTKRHSAILTWIAKHHNFSLYYECRVLFFKD
jgi:hypothetical protein